MLILEAVHLMMQNKSLEVELMLIVQVVITTKMDPMVGWVMVRGAALIPRYGMTSGTQRPLMMMVEFLVLAGWIQATS